jgi:hypothetical protein
MAMAERSEFNCCWLMETPLTTAAFDGTAKAAAANPPAMRMRRIDESLHAPRMLQGVLTGLGVITGISSSSSWRTTSAGSSPGRIGMRS